MSSRAEQKAEARAAREAAEEQAAQAAVRRKRLITFGGVLAAAAAIIVVVVLVAGGGESDPEKPGTPPSELAVFDGVPQDGTWLGDPDAPVVMEEYADLQCPFCKEFALENLPPIVEDFVKSGEVRINLRMVSILGPDSETAARFYQAAAQQNRGWQFAEAFYAEQGIEGTSYINEDFLRARAEEAGVDADKAFAAAESAEVTSAVRADQRAFDEVGLGGTPSFRIGPKDGELRTVEVGDVPAELQKEVEKAGA